VRLIGPIKTRKVLPIHGFKSVLPFQGSIQLRERDVLSLTLDKAEGLANYPFLRGDVYDEYTSGGWLAGERHEADREPMTSLAIRPYSNQRSSSPTSRWPTRRWRARCSSASANRWAPTCRQGGGQRGLGSPDFDPGSSITLMRPPDRLEPSATYSSAGLVTDATADDLRASDSVDTNPGRIRGMTPSAYIQMRYTQLPDDLPQRVRDLAQQLTASQPTTYDSVKAVEAYLRQIPIAYRLLDVPPGEDTVDYFLFESREGFFDYHASAMVVLLRAVGIPSRLAVGYALDPSAFDAENRRYNIREEHAYAWPEVYLPSFGWLAFNPSPERPAVTRAGDAIVEGATWFGGIDPEILGSLGVEPNLRPDLGPPEEDPSTAPTEGGEGGGGVPLAVWLALGIGAAAVALVTIGGRLTWERSLAGLPYPQRIWEQTLRLAGWARLGPQPEQTPVEYARDLQARAPDVEGVDLLAAAYGRSRFGRKPASAEENERLRAVWQQVRAKLLLRALYWR
jgi:transglutaminase-like putative cysteine protease